MTSLAIDTFPTLQPADTRDAERAPKLSIAPAPPGYLERIAQGDKGAMHDCIAQYGGLVWSLARRLSGSHSDAEDASQEVFIALWKCAARFDPTRASEATFITMVARRRLIDRHRKASARALEVPNIDVSNIANQDHRRIEASAEARAVSRALQGLPEERRAVLELSIYEGLTHHQISAQTKLPLGTVKSHVRRGLLALRKQLHPTR